MHSTVGSGDNTVSMSEEEVPAGPPAWPGGAVLNDPWGGAGWTSAPRAPGWWPQQYYTYEPPPPPRRTSRLVMLGVAVVIFVFAASAAATAVIATRGLSGSGNTSGVEAAVVDIDTSLGAGAAAGTGIVLTSSGIVLTNNHVVQGEEAISVRITATGATYNAVPIGEDVAHDIAVLQLQGATGLSTAPIGDSSSIHVGDSVTALGNAQGRGGAPAVANGTVTALGQQITASDETGQSIETLSGMIQTNAPIQPGDSGGPLVDSNGQVVGLDTAASGGRRGPEPGAVQAFAIPIDTALNYAHQLMAHPTTPPAGARLGVCVADSASPLGALLITGAAPCTTAVASGSPASTTGLAAGDVITSLGGAPVDSKARLVQILQGDRPGESVVVVWLDPSGQQHQATVTLAASTPQQ
ncbi:MAG: S1C family serine protease [Candidatus Dormibacteria bacterium]